MRRRARAAGHAQQNQDFLCKHFGRLGYGERFAASIAAVEGISVSTAANLSIRSLSEVSCRQGFQPSRSRLAESPVGRSNGCYAADDLEIAMSAWGR